MSLRMLSSDVLAAAASLARRGTHGLLFAAGGLRRLDDFKHAAATYFSDYNARPTEIDAGFNPLEARVYGRHVRPGARVCVIGCGTGRDLIPFVIAGHQVTGVEPSAGALEILRRELATRGRAATLLQGFAEDVTLPESYDAIILSPHCYSYIPGSQRRVAMLKKLSAHLVADGRLAINFLRRTGSWSAAGVRVAAAAARLTGSDCPWEPHDVVQLSDGGDARSITFEHFFLPAEIEEEVTRAGCRVIETEIDDFLGPVTIAGR